MSSNQTKKVVMAALLAAFAGLSTQAVAATATGTANANVLTPIAITAGQTLEFGAFTGAAGTVTVSTAGARSSTGAVVLAPTNGTVRQGTFTVTGSGNSTFGITYPSAFNITSGANNMSVTVSGPATGTLTSGTATINVGGTVTVAANQAAGAYTGTYTMTVEYN
jgi:hypothetical protein